MKILAFSDLHLDENAARAILDAAPEADLILGAGDFAYQHQGLRNFMARLDPIAARMIVIPGNNETEANLRAATRACVLHGQAVTRGAVSVLGIGGAVPPPPVVPWKSFDLSEEHAAMRLAPFTACDVLLSHAPPFGVADTHATLGPLGSHAIRAAAERLQPRLLLCGHIHDAWGAEGQIGRTRVVNLGPGPNWFTL